MAIAYVSRLSETPAQGFRQNLQLCGIASDGDENIHTGIESLPFPEVRAKTFIRGPDARFDLTTSPSLHQPGRLLGLSSNDPILIHREFISVSQAIIQNRSSLPNRFSTLRSIMHFDYIGSHGSDEQKNNRLPSGVQENPPREFGNFPFITFG